MTDTKAQKATIEDYRLTIHHLHDHIEALHKIIRGLERDNEKKDEEIEKLKKINNRHKAIEDCLIDVLCLCHKKQYFTAGQRLEKLQHQIEKGEI